MGNHHAIIAGVNKCGTTSAFRYLADHPEICASSIKELRYFVQEHYEFSDLSYDKYLTHFSDHENKRVLLEASPSYFSWGEQVSSRIVQLIPNARIVVMLRDPVERLFSYYRSALVYDNYANALLGDISFADFVDIAVKAAQDGEQDDAQKAEFRRALIQGRYADHIEDFGCRFPKEQIDYVFFEDFVKDPRTVMKDMCTFIGVNAQFFDDYQFRVQNKTRSFRSKRLQKFGYRVNMRFERILNRYPGIRKTAQSLYLWANEKRDQEEKRIDAVTNDKLLKYYGDVNAKLRCILSERYEREEFPSWLQ